MYRLKATTMHKLNSDRHSKVNDIMKKIDKFDKKYQKRDQSLDSVNAPGTGFHHEFSENLLQNKNFGNTQPLSNFTNTKYSKKVSYKNKKGKTVDTFTEDPLVSKNIIIKFADLEMEPLSDKNFRQTLEDVSSLLDKDSNKNSSDYHETFKVTAPKLKYYDSNIMKDIPKKQLNTSSSSSEIDNSITIYENITAPSNFDHEHEVGIHTQFKTKSSTNNNKEFSVSENKTGNGVKKLSSNENSRVNTRFKKTSADFDFKIKYIEDLESDECDEPKSYEKFVTENINHSHENSIYISKAQGFQKSSSESISMTKTSNTETKFHTSEVNKEEEESAKISEEEIVEELEYDDDEDNNKKVEDDENNKLGDEVTMSETKTDHIIENAENMSSGEEIERTFDSGNPSLKSDGVTSSEKLTEQQIVIMNSAGSQTSWNQYEHKIRSNIDLEKWESSCNTIGTQADFIHADLACGGEYSSKKEKHHVFSDTPLTASSFNQGSHIQNATLGMKPIETAVNELLRHQICLTRHFINSQYNMYKAYVASVKNITQNYKPVTLRETKKMIQRQRKTRENSAL